MSSAADRFGAEAAGFGAGGGLDPVGAVDQRTAAGLEAKAIEGGLPERRCDTIAEVVWDFDVVGPEGADEPGLELAFGLSGIQVGAADADPGAATKGAGADVGRYLTVGREGEPDQLLLRRRPP